MSPLFDPRPCRIEHHVGCKADKHARGWMAYCSALACICVGWFLGTTIALVTADASTTDLIDGTLGAAVVIGLSVLLILVWLKVSGSLSGNGAGSIPLAALRVAGAYSMALPFLTFLPGWLGLVVGGLVMTGIIAWLFDWDVVHSATVAFACCLLLSGVCELLGNLLI